MSKPKLLITGPYITNYSFAKVNRGLAVAMARSQSEFEVNVWRNPSFKLDASPTDQDLQKFPELAKLLTDDVADTDVLFYCGYPASPADPYGFAQMPGKVKLMYLFWEETVYPADKVKEINEHLHALIVGSTFVEHIMRRNGVTIPIHVVLAAINDNQELVPGKYEIASEKKFKFFHNSTAKHRKGVDVLLKAYFAEFNNTEDVTLVIKSFPNPDNQVNVLIARLGKDHPEHAEVVHIMDPNLTEQEIIDLTGSCDAAVYPTRTEGFGMPIAEAMYVGTPVIATGYSAHLDFCNEDNAYLIDYEMVDTTESEAVNLGAKWAEPSVTDLQEKMRYVFENIASDEVQTKVELAKAAAQNLNWTRAAAEMAEFFKISMVLPDLKKSKMAVVTTMNTVCGIAEYSRSLYSNLSSSFAEFHYLANSDVADRVREDAANVVRLWEYGNSQPDKLVSWIKENNLDRLHIQHHLSHYPISAVYYLISQLSGTKIQLYLTLHNLLMGGNEIDIDAVQLNKCTKVFVHKQSDVEYLQKKGVNNVALFVHPYDDVPQRLHSKVTKQLDLAASRPILITHGILSSHKGLEQTLEATALLRKNHPDVLWLAVNAVSINNSTSADTLTMLKQRCTTLGLDGNVRFISDFLSADEVFLLMQAADIGILAYDEVGESASGSVRKFLSAGIPTIVTDIPIMQELGEEITKIPDNKPTTLAQAIANLYEDKALQTKLSSAAKAKATSDSWNNMATRLLQEYAD